jgi:glycine C-acetyltransferase
MLQKGLREMGYSLGDTQSPITPVYVPAEPDVAMSIVAHLREKEGVFVSGVMDPVVPKGVILLRIIPTAAHSNEHVEKTLVAFKNLRDEYHLRLNEAKI